MYAVLSDEMLNHNYKQIVHWTDNRVDMQVVITRAFDLFNRLVYIRRLLLKIK